MRNRQRKKSRGRIALAAVILALVACGLLIALNVRKVADENKAERKFPQEKTMPKPAPKFPPLEPEPQTD